MKFERCFFKKDRRLEATELEIKKAKKRINKKIQKELDSMPLLAPILSEEVESKYSKSELEIKEAQNIYLKETKDYFQNLRNHAAKCWREFRKLLFSLPKEHQKKFIEKWDNSSYPKTHDYAKGVLQSYIKENNLV